MNSTEEENNFNDKKRKNSEIEENACDVKKIKSLDEEENNSIYNKEK